MQNRNHSGYSIFREVQQFRQLWLWIFILGLSAFLWFITIGALIDKSFDNKLPIALLWMIFLMSHSIGLPLLLYLAKLITEVRPDGIYYRFYPLHLKPRKIAFYELKTYYARTYRPFREYGGWGIRYAFSRGWAYNVSGNKGVQLELINGKKILLGTQRPEEFVSAIDSALRK